MATPHLQVAVTLPTPTLDEKTRHFHATVTTTGRTTNNSTSARQMQAPARFTNISSFFIRWQPVFLFRSRLESMHRESHMGLL
jgi:hypothetical protein